MKPVREFLAERAAAQHCAQLIQRGPSPAELLPMLTRAGERLARLLGGALAPLMGPATAELQAAPAERTTIEDLTGQIAPLAANSLLRLGHPDAPLLLSIDAGAVLRMVDRAFGGKGEIPADMPASFPLSAELLIARLEGLVAAQIAAVLNCAAPPEPVRRDGSLAALEPFAPGTALAALNIEVFKGLRAPWKLTIALPLSALPALLGHGDPRPAAPREARPADPAAAPFADLPLPLTALLVDMKVPLATVSRLEPGMVLPVAVARAVPIHAGAAVIAHGTVGAQDDRVAVKLTHIA